MVQCISTSEISFAFSCKLNSILNGIFNKMLCRSKLKCEILMKIVMRVMTNEKYKRPKETLCILYLNKRSPVMGKQVDIK